MIRITWILILLAGIQLPSEAQQTAPDKGLPRELVKGKGIYRFPGFTAGTIVLRNGIIAEMPLNYNISLDEMHFIDARGDTLSLADPVSVNFISLNGSRFYFDQGYLESLDSAAGFVLAFRQSFSFQYRQPGAYGDFIAHEGVRNYSFYNGNGQMYTLGNDDKIVLSPHEYYFFGDEYGHFSKTGKAFLYAHFPQYESDLSGFIKQEKINFNRLPDLHRLMAHCRSLVAPRN
jgi:hypothetical protein